MLPRLDNIYYSLLYIWIYYDDNFYDTHCKFPLIFILALLVDFGKIFKTHTYSLKITLPIPLEKNVQNNIVPNIP